MPAVILGAAQPNRKGLTEKCQIRNESRSVTQQSTIARRDSLAATVQRDTT
jgi:hypothetical protein